MVALAVLVIATGGCDGNNPIDSDTDGMSLACVAVPVCGPVAMAPTVAPPALAAAPAPAVDQPTGGCWITGYSYESCDDADCYMANGEQAHPGAAACGYAWELGTVLRLSTGEVVVCEDRGGGPAQWVDVWQGTFTDWGTCEVVEAPLD